MQDLSQHGPQGLTNVCPSLKLAVEEYSTLMSCITSHMDLVQKLPNNPSQGLWIAEVKNMPQVHMKVYLVYLIGLPTLSSLRLSLYCFSQTHYWSLCTDGVATVPANSVHYASNPGCATAVLLQVLAGLPNNYVSAWLAFYASDLGLCIKCLIWKHTH